MLDKIQTLNDLGARLIKAQERLIEQQSDLTAIHWQVHQLREQIEREMSPTVDDLDRRRAEILDMVAEGREMQKDIAKHFGTTPRSIRRLIRKAQEQGDPRFTSYARHKRVKADPVVEETPSTQEQADTDALIRQEVLDELADLTRISRDLIGADPTTAVIDDEQSVEPPQDPYERVFGIDMASGEDKTVISVVEVPAASSVTFAEIARNIVKRRERKKAEAKPEKLAPKSVEPSAPPAVQPAVDHTKYGCAGYSVDKAKSMLVGPGGTHRIHASLIPVFERMKNSGLYPYSLLAELGGYPKDHQLRATLRTLEPDLHRIGVEMVQTGKEMVLLRPRETQA